jgi:hypothetical protein
MTTLSMASHPALALELKDCRKARAEMSMGVLPSVASAPASASLAGLTHTVLVAAVTS